MPRAFTKQVNLPNPTCAKIESYGDMFRYGKKLNRSKVMQAMVWQYQMVVNSNNAIVFNDGKFEVIERK